MKIGAVDHIAVRSADAEALSEFLTDVLGLTRKGSASRRLYDLDGGVTLAVFSVGTNQGGLGEREAERLPDHIAVRVDSLEKMRQHLAGAGYTLDGDMLVAPGGLCLQFVDD